MNGHFDLQQTGEHCLLNQTFSLYIQTEKWKKKFDFRLPDKRKALWVHSSTQPLIKGCWSVTRSKQYVMCFILRRLLPYTHKVKVSWKDNSSSHVTSSAFVLYRTRLVLDGDKDTCQYITWIKIADFTDGYENRSRKKLQEMFPWHRNKCLLSLPVFFLRLDDQPKWEIAKKDLCALLTLIYILFDVPSGKKVFGTDLTARTVTVILFDDPHTTSFSWPAN